VADLVVVVWVCFDIFGAGFTGGLLYMFSILSFKKISIFQPPPTGERQKTPSNWQNLTFCVWAIFQPPQRGAEKHFGHETDCFMPKQFFDHHSLSEG
jgi:hypothetical protein